MGFDSNELDFAMIELTLVTVNVSIFTGSFDVAQDRLRLEVDSRLVGRRPRTHKGIASLETPHTQFIQARQVIDKEVCND